MSSLLLEKETDGTKSAADGSEGQMAQQDPKGNPVLRTFKQGDSLAYVYQIFNADTDPAQRAGLEVHTRLFRDGQPVYEGKPMSLQTVTQPDAKHLVAAGAMRLGAHLQPGDYVLQVIVSDGESGEKHRVATQSTDFEVEP